MRSNLPARIMPGTGALTTTVTGGYLVLPNITTAVPGAGGDTTSRSITVLANGAVVLPGATDLSPLLSRLTLASAGVVALDTSSSVNVGLQRSDLRECLSGRFQQPGRDARLLQRHDHPRRQYLQIRQCHRRLTRRGDWRDGAGVATSSCSATRPTCWSIAVVAPPAPPSSVATAPHEGGTGTIYLDRLQHLLPAARSSAKRSGAYASDV